MSGARDAIARLEAAVEPILTDGAAPLAVRKLAAAATDTGALSVAAPP